MNPININTNDTTLQQNFKEGHPVQVRIEVSEAEMQEYKKGTTVKVMCGDSEATGKIVSEPLEIQSKKEGGQKTLSLIIEKP